MTDAAALTTLGKRLLIGDGVPMSTDKALTTLRDAAAQGSGEAAALLSVCTAWGVGQARNVDIALDHLARAAELGWNPALRELQLLARDAGTEPVALRRKVDVASLRSPPGARVAFERPRIIVLERFATPEECQWLIGRAGGGLQRAKVYRDSSTAQVAETRTNREMALTIFSADVALSLIRDRIAAASGAPATHFEIAKLLHYSPGEQFALHADFIEAKTPELARELAARGDVPDLLERRLRRRRDAVPAPRLAVSRRPRRRAAVQQRRRQWRARLRHRTRRHATDLR
jgi:prolyl 4-hydroxylase